MAKEKSQTKKYVPYQLTAEASAVVESWRHTGQTPSGAIIDKELELQKLKEAQV